MNCKTGDLAIVVKSRTGNQGRIVRVIRGLDVLEYGTFYDGYHWLVKGRLCGGFCSWSADLGGDGVFADCQLRPIRDTPGEDESLQWAPVPGERVTA